MTRRINITVDGTPITVEQMPDGTFRRPDYLLEAERKVAGRSPDSYNRSASSWQGDDGKPHGMVGRSEGERLVSAPATEDAARWEGWGTALKPAWEPIVVGRKPLASTVAQNVLQFGTGALNIDACRVAFSGAADLAGTESKNRHADFGSGPRTNEILGDMGQHSRSEEGNYDGSAGRWPPNVLLGEEAAAELDRQSGVLTSGANPTRRGADNLRDAYGEFGGQQECAAPRGTDTGGASRFFPVFKYEPKAGSAERPRLADGTAHVTVKPVDLIRWLVRLVTPPGGVVLDPFAGSGTTGEACIVEGFRSVLVERDPKYAELIMTRLRKPIQPDLFGGAA